MKQRRNNHYEKNFHPIFCNFIILYIWKKYEKLGFVKTEEEKEQDGLKFTPMKLILKFNNI